MGSSFVSRKAQWFVLVVVICLFGCPVKPPIDPGDASTDDPAVPGDDSGQTDNEVEALPLESFFPIEAGTRWEWVLVPRRSEQDTPIAVSSTIGAELEGYPAPVWNLAVDAPAFFMLAFSLAGFDGAGYLVKLDDGYFFAETVEALEGLPDSTDLTRVALEPDLRPRVVWTEWNGDSFWVKYQQGTVLDLLPEDANPAYFGPQIEIELLVNCVGVSTSDFGLMWSETKLILGEDIGPLFARTKVGDLYITSFEEDVPQAE